MDTLGYITENPVVPDVAIIGAGPAGLMAAEVLGAAGICVAVYDAMPSVGRKFLRAGIGGLNLTHSEEYSLFCSRYGRYQHALRLSLEGMPPNAIINWVHGLGITTFVGSSGRIFPERMKAAPLLRAWLRRLAGYKVEFYLRHRWLGWDSQGCLHFEHPNGSLVIKPKVTVLALGGGSWPKLGSDGAWVSYLAQQGIQITPLQSSNCGFTVAWSDYFRDKFSGQPLKSVVLTFTDSHGQGEQRQGELMIRPQGLEGGLIYAFSARLRERIHQQGYACFSLDLAPHHEQDSIAEQLKSRGTQSLSNCLKKRLKFTPLKIALLHEVLPKVQMADASLLAAKIKALPIKVLAPFAIERAISSAGGVQFDNLTAQLMLKNRPGVFIAGEMLDWDAPTGGYLLTACLATGAQAGRGACDWYRLHVQ